MTRNEKKILIAVLSVFTLMISFIIYNSSRDYDYEYIDRITNDICKNNGSLKLIEVLLKYRNNVLINGCDDYYHYYANLYYIYIKYPNNVLHFKNRYLYKSTIKNMLKDGEACFETYYPNGFGKPYD